MIVQQHSLLCEWYPRGWIVHQQQNYRPNNSNKNVDIYFSSHDVLFVLHIIDVIVLLFITI